MVSVSAFFRDVPLEAGLSLLEIFGTAPDRDRLEDLSDTLRGRAIHDLLAQLPSETKTRIRALIADLERVAKAGTDAVLRPAAGDDAGLLFELGQMPSDRARAVCLYLYDKPKLNDSEVFRRAWVLSDCGAHRPNGAMWQLYGIKNMSRDWSPGQDLETCLRDVVTLTVADHEQVEREILTEVFTRPALVDRPDGPKVYTVILRVEGDQESIEGWQSGTLESIRFARDRRFCIVITPHQKTFEVGRSQRAASLSDQLTSAIAKRIFEATELEPLKHGVYRLDGFVDRQNWRVHDEHGIASIQVKKLVLTRGSGTLTYHVPAQTDADVYDLLGKSKRGISGSSILSVALRVAFKKRGRSRSRTVSFEITRPNKCTLRENHAEEALLLNTYLTEWGIRERETGEVVEGGAASRKRSLEWSDLIANQVWRTQAEWDSIFGPSYETLIAQRVLKSAGAAHAVPCPTCDVGELSDYRPLFEEMVCGHCGHRDQNNTLWTLYELDQKAFALYLALLLRLDLSQAREVEPDALYVLGQGRHGSKPSVVLAPNLVTPTDIDLVSSLMRRGVGRLGGILIGPNPMPDSFKWPYKYKFTDLDQMLHVDETGLGLRSEFASAWWDGKAQRDPGGRPSYFEFGKGLAKMRRAFGLPIQPALLLKDLEISYPKASNLPSLHTIQSDWMDQLS